MSYEVLVSRTFQDWFDDLPADTRQRVRDGLEALAEDPYEARSGADIRPLENTEPRKHRLRVGPWRVIHRIEDESDAVKVLDGFRRGRGCR